MSGILRLESLTKGNTLKQGDKTPLKYRLFDADGEKLNIAGKSAKVRLVYPDFLTIGYEKDGLTVAQDDTVTFTIDRVIPSRIYHVEIIVDDQFIFPSRADESKFTVDKSSLGTETNIIEIVGKDVLIREVKSQVDAEIQPLVTSMKSAQQAEAQRVLAENERSEKYGSYAQQFDDVILELSEEKDYHSLPEIAGARGGFDTLGGRLDDTTAQLAQTDVTHHQTEAVKSLPIGSKGGSVKDFEYKGQTLVNLVKNGDFSDGTLGVFSGITGDKTISTEHYISEGKSLYQHTNNTGLSTSYSEKISNAFLGDKFYLSFFIRPNEVLNTGVFYGITFHDSTGERVGSETVNRNTVTPNQWNKVTLLGTAPENAKEVRIQARTWAVNIFTDNFQLFNLTQTFGAGNEPTKGEMDGMIDGYIDGMQSAKADVKTVGKNLFDKNTSHQLNKFFNENGQLVSSNNWATYMEYIPIKGGTSYRASNIGESSIAFMLFYDSDKNIVGKVATGAIVRSPFVTPVNATFMRVCIKTDMIDPPQIEEGTTATEYEPYKSSTLTLTEEPTLHRLPNGVADRVFEQGGQLWLERNVGEHEVVESNFSVIDKRSVVDRIRISTSVLDNPYISNPFDSESDSFRAITDRTSPKGGTTFDTLENVWQHWYDPSLFNISFPKDTYATVEEARADLAGTKILYQLATPELINLTEQGLATGELMSYTNGTSYNNGSIKGEVSFKVPTSTGAQITSLVDSSERQAKQIAILSDHVAQLISGV